ncbi:hypothetical protein DPMN_134193 [Dreissena polymorpha]|uniref:Uncharacterized protein n=1 Tax=Dreissena polymorpha TaxID=45954 RepID=A0A9D4FVT0_DREPO|nr:hypothetical protein DPMN_134193 [Dreissena polymorpha]
MITLSSGFLGPLTSVFGGDRGNAPSRVRTCYPPIATQTPYPLFRGNSQCSRNRIVKDFANSFGPDETPQNVASHQDPSCLIATLIIGLGCGLCFLVALTSVFGICVKGIVIATVARSAGILQMCSGLLMAAGVGIYPNGWDAPEVQQACGFTSKSYSLGDCSLSWCFYVTSAGILVTLMCAALAFHAPKQKQFMAGYSL